MTESPILRWMHLVVGGQKLVETPVIDVQCCHMWPTVATGKLASILFSWHKTSLVGMNSSCWYIGKKIRAQDSSIGSLSDPTRNHSQPNSTWLRNQPTVVALAFGFLEQSDDLGSNWHLCHPLPSRWLLWSYFPTISEKKITDFLGNSTFLDQQKRPPHSGLHGAQSGNWLQSQARKATMLSIS